MECNKGLCRKLIKLAVVLLFTVGIVVQFYSCFDQYFKYEVISLIKVKKEPHQMPAVTVCPSTYRGSLWKKLRSETLDARYNLIPGYSEYVKSCELTLPSNIRVNCTQVTKVSEYIGIYGKCFALFRSSHLLVKPDQLVYHENDDLTWNYLTIKLHSSYRINLRWIVRVNPPDQPLIIHRRDLSKQLFEVNLFTEMNNQVDYEVKYQLPPPYHDGCFEYSKTPFKTRYKAIYDCINKNYKNQSSGIGYWHLMAMIEHGKEFVNESSFYREESPKQRATIYPKVIRDCTRKYQLNACYYKHYTLNIVSTRRGPKNNSGITLNFVNLPHKYLQMVYVPCICVIDFINTVGGIFSLWFNFALFAWFSEKAEFLLKKLAKRKVRFPSTQCDPSASKWLKVTNCVIIFLCSLGCTLQCLDIGKIYIENNLYTWISGVEPEETYFPTLTFCVDRVLLPEKVQMLYPQIYNSVPREKWSQHFTIDQMFNLTLDLEDIFVDKSTVWYSSYVSTSMKLTPILKEYSFDKELTNKYVCFSTFAPHNYNGTKPIQAHQLSQLSMSFYFMLFLRKMSSHLTKELKIIVHFSRSFPMDRSASSQLSFSYEGDDRINPSLIYFSMNELRQILVPDSIASKCFVYEKIEFDSREDAIQTCIYTLMKKRYKVWPNDIPVSMEKGRGLKFVNESSWNQTQSVNEICMKKFPLPSCNGRFTSLRFVNYGFFFNYTQIILYPPSDSYTEVRQDFRFTISQLLVYIGSNINTWLGIAMSDILNRF